MIQQIIAIALILLMLTRLIIQKKKKQMKSGEFYLWLFFWFFAGIAIIFIRKIDFFVGVLGFSAKGIDVLLYLAVVFLFYIVFRLRLKIEKQDRIITKIIREIALINKE